MGARGEMRARKLEAKKATAILGGIADADCERSGHVLAGMPPISAGQPAGGLLGSHIDEHLGSIGATVGR